MLVSGRDRFEIGSFGASYLLIGVLCVDYNANILS